MCNATSYFDDLCPIMIKVLDFNCTVFSCYSFIILFFHSGNFHIYSLKQLIFDFLEFGKIHRMFIIQQQNCLRSNP